MSLRSWRVWTPPRPVGPRSRAATVPVPQVLAGRPAWRPEGRGGRCRQERREPHQRGSEGAAHRRERPPAAGHGGRRPPLGRREHELHAARPSHAVASRAGAAGPHPSSAALPSRRASASTSSRRSPSCRPATSATHRSISVSRWTGCRQTNAGSCRRRAGGGAAAGPPAADHRQGGREPLLRRRGLPARSWSRASSSGRMAATRSGKGSEVRIPDTIQEVLLARIDRLQQGPRETVQLASVIGREFSRPLLERISDPQTRLDAALSDLKELEFIYEAAYVPEFSYAFKHALSGEVAYSTLLQRAAPDPSPGPWPRAWRSCTPTACRSTTRCWPTITWKARSGRRRWSISRRPATGLSLVYANQRGHRLLQQGAGRLRAVWGRGATPRRHPPPEARHGPLQPSPLRRGPGG